MIVLADRGLYARWLFRRIMRLGWHPFLRINTGGPFAPTRRPPFSHWPASCPTRGRTGTAPALPSRAPRGGCGPARLLLPLLGPLLEARQAFAERGQLRFERIVLGFEFLHGGDGEVGEFAAADQLVALLVGAHQLGEHLLDVLGDEADVDRVPEMAVRELVGAPAEPHRFELGDPAEHRADRTDVGLQARVG